MIFIDGVPFSSASSSSQGNEILATLLEHPLIVSAANIFKTIPERKFSVPKEFGLENSPQAKHVYVFQREYATVDPSLVELVGTDEATTCIGLVIRNQKSGMTSVAHMDSQKTVDLGLIQMLTSVIDHEMDDELDVHLIGGFDDTPDEDVIATTGAGSDEEQSGHSLPLCSKIIEALQSRREKFQIQTLFVLGHNTKRDSDGNACPLVNGFLVETSTGSLRPASFDKSSRCPDEIVRRLRVTVSSLDPTWNGRLLETYDTHHDRFHIAPCSWSPNWKYIASWLQQCSDSEILLECSTSPSAEGPDFVDNEKR
ncbi:protein N-terminal asparagine amidohydrolase isoform X2 [Magnolia sinica]|nr:protein N-terminal asparagine amidohydrolase isoform X2 [Magnolia sinica]